MVPSGVVHCTICMHTEWPSPKPLPPNLPPHPPSKEWVWAVKISGRDEEAGTSLASSVIPLGKAEGTGTHMNLGETGRGRGLGEASVKRVC